MFILCGVRVQGSKVSLRCCSVSKPVLVSWLQNLNLNTSISLIRLPLVAVRAEMQGCWLISLTLHVRQVLAEANGTSLFKRLLKFFSPEEKQALSDVRIWSNIVILMYQLTRTERHFGVILFWQRVNASHKSNSTLQRPSTIPNTRVTIKPRF